MAKCYDAMTNQEAIKELKFHCVNCLGNQEEDYCENYCEYGVALEALEKQRPQPLKLSLPNNGDTCQCGRYFDYADNDMYDWKYCPVCGHKISEWGSDNE